MARPLTKPVRIEIRLTAEEHTLLVEIAAGRPLGPVLVAEALGRRIGPGDLDADPKTPAEGLDAWERRWMPLVRKTAPLPYEVTKAIAAARKALR